MTTLTLEEQQELELLELEDQEKSEPVDNLTSEEVQELQLLEQELQASQQQIVAEVEQPELDPSEYESVVNSLLEGVTLGHSGELVGAISTVQALAEGDISWAEKGAFYRKNRDLFDKVRSQGAEKYGSAMGAEIAGGFILPGAGTVKGAAALGAAAGFGKGRGLDIQSTVGGAILGGTLAKVLPGISGAVQNMSKKLGKKASKETLRAIGVIDPEGKKFTPAMEKLHKVMVKRGKTVEDFGNEIQSLASRNGADLIEKGDALLSISSKANSERIFWNNQIEDIVSNADQAIAANPELGISTNKVIAELKNHVIEPLANRHPSAAKQALKAVEGHADRAFLSFSEVRSTERALKSAINKFAAKDNNIPSVIDDISLIAEREIEIGLRKVSPDMSKAFKAASEMETNFSEVVKTLARPTQDSFVRMEESLMKSIINGTGRTPKQLLLEGPVSIARLVKSSIDTTLLQPQGSLAINKINSLNNISKALDLNPGKYQDLSTRLLLASGRTVEAFQSELAYAESVINLDQAPLQRNSIDLQSKLPEVLNIIADENPELANDLTVAMQENNQSKVGEIMSNVSRLSKVQRWIEPGMGWNGKAATAQDMREAESLVKNSNMTNSQKMMKIDSLRINGTLPVMEEPVDLIKVTVQKKRNEEGKKEVDF
jgi:hypothetical protein